jgi:hypothetical protein
VTKRSGHPRGHHQEDYDIKLGQKIISEKEKKKIQEVLDALYV